MSPRHVPAAAGAPLPTTVPARRIVRPRWTDTRLLLGVLLVLASVVMGSRVVASAQQTRPVWAAARELPVGSVVRADDLVVAQVRLADSATRYLPVVGRPPTGLVVARTVGAGELVPAAALTQTADQPSGHLVSVPVEALHYPPGLDRGDVVDVFVSATDGAAPSGDRGPGGPQRVLVHATVAEVDDPAERLGRRRHGSGGRALGARRGRAGRHRCDPLRRGRSRPGRGAVSPSERVPVLLATTGRPYEEDLLAAFARPGGRLRVVRRCLDLTDLLAVAATAGATVAVVWSRLHRLDRESVARLAAQGVAVVAVVEPREPSGADAGNEARRMLDLGAAVALPAPAPGDAAGTRFGAELMAQVVAIHSQRVAGRAVPTAVPSTGVPADLGPVVGSPGRLVVVWGPTGAPGRTTVAVTLADELARAGEPVLLADADTYGPSVAQRLGILDEVSGMAAAARAANAGTLDATSLDSATRALPHGLRVLTGLTRADRWPELPATALMKLWRVVRSVGGAGVVDVGFCLEEDDELSFDGVPLRRNASTLTSLAAADAVVVVGGADPVGLSRLLRAWHELDRARPALPRLGPRPSGGSSSTGSGPVPSGTGRPSGGSRSCSTSARGSGRVGDPTSTSPTTRRRSTGLR